MQSSFLRRSPLSPVRTPDPTLSKIYLNGVPGLDPGVFPLTDSTSPLGLFFGVFLARYHARSLAAFISSRSQTVRPVGPSIGAGLRPLKGKPFFRRGCFYVYFYSPSCQTCEYCLFCKYCYNKYLTSIPRQYLTLVYVSCRQITLFLHYYKKCRNSLL